MATADPITLTDEERTILIRWSHGRSTEARLVERAKIILLAAEGKTNTAIAEELNTERHKIGRWRERFIEGRLKGIEKDRHRSGRKPIKRNEMALLIIEKTLQEKPANATHWTTRTLAKELGTNHEMVHRVWQANGLKPHLTEAFKLSRDKRFAEKLIDVVGLYMNPPINAMVLSVDEKSQIQALDRTQPGLPLWRGRCGTYTHDYKRNGTTTLFAAMEMAEGKIIASCMPRHRNGEWLQFLKQIDRETPPNLDLHLIVDNYSTHKHPNVKEWLKAHPRFHIHFTPTSSSWLNLIERWFRDLTEKLIRRGAFHSVPDLIDAIMKYVGAQNENPKPFIWTAGVQEILAKVERARSVMQSVQNK